jgi:hypothetical protein
MAIAFTWDSLFNALQSWPVDRNDQYQADLTHMIALAETRLLRDLNLELFDLKQDVTVSNGVREVSKPADLLATRTMNLTVGTGSVALRQRSYDFCIAYQPDSTVTGVPAYYAELSETQWYVVPTPVQGYTANVRYVARPTGLSPTVPSTWLSRNVGDLLFSACLMESEHYLKADDRFADMKARYDRDLPIAKLELRGSMRMGDYTPMAPAAQKLG